ncbi:NAD(P)-dependent oxidoreductase [Nonomuraea sp. KC401]|uniref:NAD(P)-dependent oxidoreductase n=1 Tax=unclassified Nonomuraea TaxID=2593643 RepID=UPI0010FF10D1|nr:MULTISPECIES: NAD(P)-dependent oxidoreductase [unclassified Nonomuraea]NBE93731.1 NAD-binding protein [Nonomuraea sp. K271]TLF76994.1 NAD(P)-dependent oxidoreductase [Nonomuraea sp. KC401]
MSLPHVALVGSGAMGAGMGHRLLEAGHPLSVYNRTPSKVASLVEAGARAAASPRAAADTPIVLLSLSDESAVEQVLFEAMLPELSRGTVVVDTTTTSPLYARMAATRLSAAGIARVEACVLGNPAMARSGGLRIFTAGEHDEVEAAGGLLGVLGQDIRYLGSAGAAATMKLAFNLLLGVQTVGFTEAISYGVSAGLDRDLLIDVIANSGFSSPVLAFRAAFMRERCYEPAAFKARLMEKDLRLAANDAMARGICLPLTEGAGDLMADAVAAGLGDQDAAVISELPKRRLGESPPPKNGATR